MSTRSCCLICVALLALSLVSSTTTKAQLFDPYVEYCAGDSMNEVAIGDLDGDGHSDMATLNFNSNAIVVFPGNGDGTFQSVVTHGTGDYPMDIAIDDLDGDGHPDLVTANWEGTVSILLGNGDGTFQAAVGYGTGDLSYEASSAVAIGDLDGDSHLDLAVANANSDTVAVLLGNGDGTFQTAVEYAAGAGYFDVATVAIGDLDGAGHPDLVTTSPQGDVVLVLPGNGDGTFQSAVTYGVGASAHSVAIGDLDGNGHPDLATANQASADISVLLGNGDGTFQASVEYGVGDSLLFSPNSITIGDLDGDGRPDLAVVNDALSSVSVLAGNGDGSFQTSVEYAAYAVDGYPYTLTMGDLDRDSDLDLVVAGGTTDCVTVLINRRGTISAGLNCSPTSGIVPFMEWFEVRLMSHYSETFRIIDARIDVQLANGSAIPSWKSGHTGVFADFPFSRNFTLMIPELSSVVGTNTFTLIAEDTTPAPFNQPPYPSSGYMVTSACEVVGIAP